MDCLSLTAIKPALIHYNRHAEEPIVMDEILKYYLESQIRLFGKDPGIAQRVIDELKGYYIHMAEVFTPVMVPIK
jgi:hypothetical protein